MDTYDVIGTAICATTTTDAALAILNARQSGKGGYVCFANAHTTVMARRSSEYHQALGNSLLSLPDGRPLYWVGRAKVKKPIEHLPGPDFMLDFMAMPECRHLRHYFYGSTEQVLKQLVENLTDRLPDVRVAGYESPPFRVPTQHELEETILRIKTTGADIVWIGLGAPKQELWMTQHWQSLRPAVLLGVGAAFDFHAGTLSRAPDILKHLGLEWLYRLSKEPNRLLKRYVMTNSLFIYYLAVDIITRNSKP